MLGRVGPTDLNRHADLALDDISEDCERISVHPANWEKASSHGADEAVG